MIRLSGHHKGNCNYQPKEKACSGNIIMHHDRHVIDIKRKYL